MEIQKNVFVDGLHQKPILVDIYFQANQTPKPVIIFAHGFKGFKDWGHFDLVAREFANQNFAFVKFNFSHNGTTPENPLSFNDLEAFGHNNFSIELDDLKSVMNFILGEKSPLSSTEITREQLYLLGHSRGGGIVILKAREDERVKKIVTWASVNEFGKFWPEETIEEWKENGVLFVENARTG
ncbi:hypothetical protein GWO43_13475, partial [candidate division KSB1 bacterium]|nr:hypothetical protein [candidate division KSB1 bacterium]NIS24940.1 hypothetical protein [candidate division KSB1 bacterium]NIT71860.1 hypothetical protein [candidate division KSB1 bacterium]NIU25593.1 hypothetical protein [candidate division KSB1 bacterium]NIV91990.1 hypothetical protein [candidate division KSB1 bacterium]